MPSIDINTILSAALAAAVAEAVAPLVARIEALEINIAMMQNSIDQKDTRIAALENNPAIGVDTTLERRVAALETHTPVLDQHGGLLEYLDNQEWFWDKLTYKAKEVADAAVEQSMDHHLECYDHDNYDEIASKVDDMPDADELATKDDLSESVRDAVQDLSFEIRVR